MTAFVDASAFYAAADTGDSSSERAREILIGEAGLVTSDHVLVETWRLLRDRLGYDSAERFWDGLRLGPAAIEPAREQDLEAAWQIGTAFADRRFSLVDRTSFAVIERLGSRGLWPSTTISRSIGTARSAAAPFSCSLAPAPHRDNPRLRDASLRCRRSTSRSAP